MRPSHHPLRVALLAVWASACQRSAPEITHVDEGTFHVLGDAFNAAADRPRLLVMLSPT